MGSEKKLTFHYTVTQNCNQIKMRLNSLYKQKYLNDFVWSQSSYKSGRLAL